MESDKLRIIMDYQKLSPDIKEKIQLTSPSAIDALMVNYRNSKGKTVLALRFETDEIIYLLRVSEEMAMKLIEIDIEDDDYSQNLDADLINEEIGSDIDKLFDRGLLAETDGFIS